MVSVENIDGPEGLIDLVRGVRTMAKATDHTELCREDSKPILYSQGIPRTNE